MSDKAKAGIMVATHEHDCDKCQFIGATHSDRGKTTDWYVCGMGKGQVGMSIIGRQSSKGSDYWSMDVDTLYRVVSHPAHIVASNTYAFSETGLIAFGMLNMWREKQ